MQVATLTATLAAGACAPGKEARIEEVLRRSRAAPERVVDLESPYLVDEDRDVRAMSAWAIGDAAAPGAAPSLAPLVRDPEPVVRRAAAIALCRAGGPEAIEPLALLTRDVDVGVRRAVARCFESLALVPPDGLAQLLMDDDKEVRRCALRALAGHPDPRSLASLCQVLRTREPDEQMASVVALRALGDPSALPELERAAASRLAASVRGPVEAAIIELRAIKARPVEVAEPEKPVESE